MNDKIEIYKVHKLTRKLNSIFHNMILHEKFILYEKHIFTAFFNSDFYFPKCSFDEDISHLYNLK